jgi:hypothetical protein
MGRWEYDFRRLFWLIKFKGQAQILGRYTCLGAHILKIISSRYNIVNIQTGRIDYLLECVQNSLMKAKTRKIAPYINRKEIVPLILQEEMLFNWLNPKHPQVLFMDSLSELADQLFIHKTESWHFTCSYSNVNHSEEFKNKFLCEGLIPIDKLRDNYIRFYLHIRKNYGNLPIYYLHFPMKLETRDKFRTRHIAILEIVNEISKEFMPFYSLSVNEAIVDWPKERTADMEKFPYHYNNATYEAFVEMIKGTSIF